MTGATGPTLSATARATLLRQAGEALSTGRPLTVLPALQDAARTAPADPDILANLAMALYLSGDHRGMVEVLDRVLTTDPRHLWALLMKGAAYEQLGEPRKAGQAFSNALAVAPPFDAVPPDLRGLVRHASETVARFRREWGDVLLSGMERDFGSLSGRDGRRITETLDIYLGRRQVYTQRPIGLYIPGLPGIQFYEREDFPWLADIEAGTEAIRTDLARAMADEDHLVPYVDYPDNVPLDQWAELNRSPRWGAWHIKKDGAVTEAGRRHCAETLRLLETAPQPDLPGRSPTAMFSILKPRTHIPPHTGVTNARLVVHIPLVLPGACSFRVGNDVREWRMGEAFIFNDTIEHEARNDSDRPRTVLIFDIWNPALTEVDKRMIAVIMRETDAFLGTAPSGTI